MFYLSLQRLSPFSSLVAPTVYVIRVANSQHR